MTDLLRFAYLIFEAFKDIEQRRPKNSLIWRALRNQYAELSSRLHVSRKESPHDTIAPQIFLVRM